MYITKLSWHLHPDLNSAGKSQMMAIWSPSWERVLSSASIPRVRLHIAVLGAPAYNPRPQTDIIISLRAKRQLWFNFYSGVCFTLWVRRLLRPQGAARALGAYKIWDPLPFLPEVLPDWLCLSLGTWAASRQVRSRSEVRPPASEACTRLPLF